MLNILLFLACSPDTDPAKRPNNPQDSSEDSSPGDDSGAPEDALASVELISPVSDARLPHTMSFMAEASMLEDGGGIAEIEYWVDAERVASGAPGEVVVGRSEALGLVVVTAIAVDDAGRELGSDQVEVEVGVGLNDRILDVLSEYPTDGSYGYWWPEDDGVWWGTPDDLWYLDTLLSPGDPYGRSYCVGLTWQIAMTALAETLGGSDVSINGITLGEMEEFRIDWFVRFIWGAGPVEAVTNYGVGEWVQDLDRVQPGDFVQFWRNNESGHSAIFMGWLYDNSGNRSGIRYWSTQSSTDGIGERSEEFGSGSSDVREDLIFVARLWDPIDWTEGGSSF